MIVILLLLYCITLYYCNELNDKLKCYYNKRFITSKIKVLK